MALDRKTIVAAALDLLDSHGIEGFSMRRLAQALGVQAPSIYWHYPDKVALFDDMADALLEDVARSPAAASDYIAVLRQLAGELRQALGRRRDGALVYAGTFVVRDNVLRLADTLIDTLTGAGFDGRTATRTVFSMLYYVLGFVIEEQALTRQVGLDASGMAARLAEMADDRYPALRAVLPHIADADHDARFAHGIDLLLRGLAKGGPLPRDQVEQFAAALRAAR